MRLIEVNSENLQVYLNLAQGYEAEFSRLTKKRPSAAGLFELDTVVSPPVHGYLVYVGDTPAGLAAVKSDGAEGYEVSEFYVVPCFRGSKCGQWLAHALWSRLPGRWVIKQIEGADDASRFWRKVITRYRTTLLEEDSYHDPYWGPVTRQQFCV